jgi:hypothetical protein
MKKLIPFLALTVLATGAYAQGVITFANNVLTPPPYVTDVDRTTRLTGTQYAAQLYYGASASSLAAHTAAPNRFRAAGSSLAGTWSTTTGANRTLTGGGVGVPVFVQVRVWDLNAFATYEAAVAGGGITGVSSVFTYNQRLSAPPATTDTYMQDASGAPLFAGFSLVPEPSVIGLGIIGVGALFMLRRRK